MPMRTALTGATPRVRRRSSPRTPLRRVLEGQGSEPTQVLDGREALTPVFDDLNRYQATMHFNGQSTVALDGDRAPGDSYTIAHHGFGADGARQMPVAWLRYLDTSAKVDGSWYSAERNIILEWSETRALGMPTSG